MTIKRVTLVAAAIAAVLFASFAAHAQALPDAPAVVHARSPMWDFYLAWGAYGASVAADGLTSAKWAGTGTRPCGYEGNPAYAYRNGKFRAGSFARDNALIYGGLFAMNYVIRKKGPKRWAYRLFTDATPMAMTPTRVVQLTHWFELCH